MLVCRGDLSSDYDNSIDEDYAPQSSAEMDEDGANNDVEGPAFEEANDDNACPTARLHTQRPGKASSSKKKSLMYYIPCHGQDIRVCKVFYLTTMDVSHKRIETYHASKHATLTPFLVVNHITVDHPQIKNTYLTDIPIVFSMRSMLTNARKLRDHQANFTLIARYSILSLILNFLLPRRIDVMHMKQ